MDFLSLLQILDSTVRLSTPLLLAALAGLSALMQRGQSGERRVHGRIFQRRLAGLQKRVEAGFQTVQRRAHDLALFRAHTSKRFHEARDTALLAQFRHPYSVERSQVACGINRL